MPASESKGYNIRVEKENAAELKTVEKMMWIYCHDKHGGKKLCADCGGLLSYAANRLRLCPHHPKPACKNCPGLKRCLPPFALALLHLPPFALLLHR